MVWKDQPKSVIAAYTKFKFTLVCTQVPWDTYPVGIRGGHTPRLNTSSIPIVNKYREGKAKRRVRNLVK